MLLLRLRTTLPQWQSPEDADASLRRGMASGPEGVHAHSTPKDEEAIKREATTTARKKESGTERKKEAEKEGSEERREE